MSTTIEKLDEFTKNAEKTLDNLAKNNSGAGEHADSIRQFRDKGLAPALALADALADRYESASTIGGPGGSRSSTSKSE